MSKPIPYIAPESISSELGSALSSIPPSAELAPRDFKTNPLTREEETALALAKLSISYNSLFAACRKLINRARPANKLKHNYYVCAADFEGVIAEMDAHIAGVLDKALGNEADEPEVKL